MLKIGWSMKDVSTELPVCIPGQFYMRVSQGVLDPITVTALTLSDENDYVIFLSCDLVTVRAGILDEIREKVVQMNPQIDPLKVIMHVTHTHSGPLLCVGDSYGNFGEPGEVPLGGVEVTTANEYRPFFTDKAAEAVVESFASKESGSVAYGYGFAVVGHSRRVVYLDDTSKRSGSWGENSLIVNGRAQMYGITRDDNFSHYEAGADHFSNFLFTFDQEDKLTGAIINIPCPSQNSAGESLLSADYWHDVRVELKKRYGDIFVLPQCAAAGDLAPRILHYREAQERRFRLKYSDFKPDPRAITPGELKIRKDIAERICNAFDEVYSWASREKYAQLPIVHSVKTVHLDRRLVPEDTYASACRAKERQLENMNFITEGEPLDILKHNTILVSESRRYDSTIERYQTQTECPTHPMEMHIVKVGDVAFATNQFELFMDYQHRIQARSPFVQTFIVQLAAQPGMNNGSYLPTERGVWGKGYSASIFDNVVSPSGGQQLVEETLKELNRIR